jgi:Ca2+-binding EF-hand superfamily protein
MKKLNYVAPFVVMVALVQLLIPVSAKSDNELIEKLDLDKDGQITIKEAVANPAVLASFGKIDRDGNGKISPLEMAKTKVILTKVKNIGKPKEQISKI